MYTYCLQEWSEGADVICSVWGVMNIITGIIIVLSSKFVLASNVFIISLSFLYFFVGIRSVGKHLFRGGYYDWRGYLDIISGLLLLSIYYGLTLGIFSIFGILIGTKGFVSLFSIIMKE